MHGLILQVVRHSQAAKPTSRTYSGDRCQGFGVAARVETVLVSSLEASNARSLLAPASLDSLLGTQQRGYERAQSEESGKRGIISTTHPVRGMWKCT